MEGEEVDQELAGRERVIINIIVSITIAINSWILLCRNGTSMISLVIPPKDQVSRISKMLADEYGTASNIKSRVNRCVQYISINMMITALCVHSSCLVRMITHAFANLTLDCQC